MQGSKASKLGRMEFDLESLNEVLTFVEQYVNRAMKVADHVYVLGRGQVRFTGDPSELDDRALARLYLGDAAIPLSQ